MSKPSVPILVLVTISPLTNVGDAEDDDGCPALGVPV